MCAATADSPRAATATGSAPGGSSTSASSRTAANWAMLPSPGAMPAPVGNQTVRPACRPTPWTPGTYGVRGRPKYEMPLAHSRSSGVSGAACTSTRTSPSPGRGGSRSATRGGPPGSVISAARILMW